MSSLDLIRQRLEQLIEAPGARFNEAERVEVATLIRVHEYGLALETLALIIVEESRRIDPAVFREMIALSREMSIEHVVVATGIERCVAVDK